MPRPSRSSRTARAPRATSGSTATKPPPDNPGPLAVYGSDAPEILQLASANPELARPLHPRLPITVAEVVWAARMEMARTVEDVLSRRTRSLLLDAAASIEAAPAVARLLADELGRDAAWAESQPRAFASLAQGYLPASLT